MQSIEQILLQKLNERISQNSFRVLVTNKNLIDFSSNDYLGFSASDWIESQIKWSQQKHQYPLGSTGSRLLTGNQILTEELETDLAQYHHTEAALLFNSGYNANIGLLSTIPQKNDTIISDEYIHASLIDGIRLNYAHRYKFKHNDLTSLESKLKLAKGSIFIVVESVYSMDGDTAPLVEIVVLAKKYNAHLIVDEAHALGVFGENGMGLCQELQIEKEIFARIVTFGKALGGHGAVILGSKNLKNYLINFCRSFIYTTAAPNYCILHIKFAYQNLHQTNKIAQLKENITYFNNLLGSSNLNFIKSDSAIQGVLISGNEQAKKKSKYLQSKGYDVRAILHPTVPIGKERLRICLHSFNTKEEIKNLLTLLND